MWSATATATYDCINWQWTVALNVHVAEPRHLNSYQQARPVFNSRVCRLSCVNINSACFEVNFSDRQQGSMHVTSKGGLGMDFFTRGWFFLPWRWYTVLRVVFHLRVERRLLWWVFTPNGCSIAEFGGVSHSTVWITTLYPYPPSCSTRYICRPSIHLCSVLG